MKADIIISTHIKNDEGEETEEFFTVGQFDRLDLIDDGDLCLDILDVNEEEFNMVDDTYIIRYEENSDFGYKDCYVSIKIQPEMVIIERRGKASTVLFIEKGHRHESVYKTPYGDMTLGVSTFEFKNQLDEDGGTLFIRYGIDLNNDTISENTLDISVTVIDPDEYYRDI